MALSKIQSESINLADDFAFTGSNSFTGKLNFITKTEQSLSDISAGSSICLDAANCFTSDYEDYYIRYYLQGESVNSQNCNFALETGGVSLGGTYNQLQSPIWSTETFNSQVLYGHYATSTTGTVDTSASTYCFLGANLSNNNDFFDGVVLLRNVYSRTGFSYDFHHHMSTTNGYWESGGGGTVNNAPTVAARGIRFWVNPSTTSFGEGGATNTYGRIEIFGVVKP